MTIRHKRGDEVHTDTIGKRLRNLRRVKDLSQKELSMQLKCHQTLISKYERNIESPSTDNLVALAKFYGVTTDYLLYGDELELHESELDSPVMPIPADTSLPNQSIAWTDLAHTLTRAMTMHEETARIQAEAMKIQAENDRIRIEKQAENDRLRIEKVEAVAQDNLRRLLNRLEQLPIPDAVPHSASRADEATAHSA